MLQTTLDFLMTPITNTYAPETTVGGVKPPRRKRTRIKIKVKKPHKKTQTRSASKPYKKTYKKPYKKPNTVQYKKPVTKHHVKSKFVSMPTTASHTDYVFTDGSTFNNGKVNSVGGIGVYFKDNDKRNISEPFLLKPITNNRCEIFAVIKAIETYVSGFDTKSSKFRKRQLIIYCDSMYTINLITKWVFHWKNNGWRTANGKDVKNKDLIVWLDSLINLNRDYFTITFEHAKAHRTKPRDTSSYDYFLWYGNHMADRFATNASKVVSNSMQLGRR